MPSFNDFNCIVIDGSLSVESSSDIIDLDVLSNLLGIDNLYIEENESLLNIDGLSNLESANNLVVNGNTSLTNIDGLFNISTVNIYIAVLDNPLLEDIDGLSNPTTENISMGIWNNLEEDLKGLSSVSVSEGNSYGCKTSARFRRIDYSKRDDRCIFQGGKQKSSR